MTCIWNTISDSGERVIGKIRLLFLGLERVDVCYLPQFTNKMSEKS